jgi:hypothetical protein
MQTEKYSVQRNYGHHLLMGHNLINLGGADCYTHVTYSVMPTAIHM